MKNRKSVKPVEPQFPRPNITAAARVCYDAWVREAGYAHDARIKQYSELKEHSRIRWRRIAEEVLTAAGWPQ